MRWNFRPFTFLGLLALTVFGITPATAFAQERGQQDDEDEETTYSDVITDEAVTDEGLFDVHTIGDDIFYEIPLAHLDEEMLLLTRIAKTPDGAGYGGSKVNTATVRWQRHNDRILLRLVSYDNVADESTEIARAVEASNFEPIIAAFDIETFSTDSTAVVIDVTDLFTTDIPMLGLQSFRRSGYGVRSLDRDRTFVNYVHSFPTNVEVRRTVTYVATEAPSNAETNTFSAEMHHSMVQLPEVPMQPRRCDDRVGFFSLDQVDYGLDNQRAETRCYITRWRLEPSDPAAYARGELVDPIEPIVYYIDPATPAKWVPYLKQGIEDWQVAFEEAGFSNAIVARDAPNDPEWDPEDARYSVVRYLASDIQNASGPHVHDPRTGQILESDIQWYHNVMNLLRNWFFVQTAAVNPDARGVEFSDEVMGELVRFVSSHEVGHTLGLQHNMQSSAAYPVEQLRTRFTCEMGIAPSIMDYARFNYVAQPGDDTCFMPAIGPYDKFAIEWGYRRLPGETMDSERADLNDMVAEMQVDPVYRFSSPTGEDPTALTEAIGDDAMRASDYGMANLERIMENLEEWTYQEGEDYDQLEELYGQIVGQWARYYGHVVVNIGGNVAHRKRQGQDGAVFTAVPAEAQRRAMEWMNRQVFQTPEWMLDESIISKISSSGTLDQVRARQVSALNQVLNTGRMNRLVEQEAFHGSSAYSLGEMLDDLREGVWSEATSGRATDAFRRNLQRAYVDRMGTLMEDDAALASDVAPFVREQLTLLHSDLVDAAASASDRATRVHFMDMATRIADLLDMDG